MPEAIQVFLAEDDHDDSFLFQEALARLPYLVNLLIAEDGEQLIGLIDKYQSPDFIFLDLNMPRKDGYEVLDHIRSIAAMEEVTVIILSTSSSSESVDRAFRAGADLYIKKPDNFPSLVRAIDTCLQRKDKNPDKPSKEEFLLMV